MTAAPHSNRPVWAVILLALLALRLLAPAGFMPAFDYGAVTIVACPDGAAEGPMPHHLDHHRTKFHQICPYAAAATPAVFGHDVGILAEAIPFLSAPLLGRPYLSLTRTDDREPPRLTGPPLPA